MSALSIPSRASDSGPEQGERKDWRDWLEDAEIDIRTASGLYRDDPNAERKLRCAAIESAIDELKAALALVGDE